MPRVPRYTIDALRDLDRQLGFAPPATRRRHMEAIERLVVDIEPDRNYPEDFIIFRITGYRSDNKDGATFVGRALVRDLCSLIASLSDGLDIAVDPDRPAVSIDDAAARLGVSAKTIHRYRRNGLICHYLVHEDEKKRLSCFVDQLEAFTAQNAAKTSRAKDFTRIDDSTSATIINEARLLKQKQNVTLNKAAHRLANRYNRSHETIRQLLRRHDDGNPKPIFSQRGPLTDRQIRFIGRASQWDVPVSQLMRRFGKTRPTIHRATNRWRAERLRKIDLKWINLPTFAMDDADQIILTPSSVTDGLFIPEEASHAISLINWAHAQKPGVQAVEDAQLAAYNALKRRAATLVESLGDHPRSAKLDRIETDLRWAAMLKRCLIFRGLPASIIAIERATGRGLHEQPGSTITTMLNAAFESTGRAVDQVDPSRHQQVSRLSTFLTDRAVAAMPASAERPRASARHVESEIPLDDLASRQVVWHQLTDPPSAVVAYADQLETDVVAAINRRYGLPGQRPLTLRELAVATHCTVAALSSQLARARRRIRRIATDDRTVD